MGQVRPLHFWLFVAVLAVGFFAAFHNVLLPFVVGLAVAYFMAPLAGKFEKWGCPRSLAAFLSLFLFAFLVTGFIFLLVPLIQVQIMELIEWLPKLIAFLEQKFQLLQQKFEGLVAQGDIPPVSELAKGSAAGTVKWATGLESTVNNSSAALLNVGSLIVITPDDAFYMLRDWKRLVRQIDSLFPRDSADKVRMIFKEIDAVLSAFARGQMSVCLLLGTFYAVGLTLAGLQFGLVVGLLSGILSFVPYLGSILGLVLSLGLAFTQFSSWEPIAVVAAIYGAGQLLEGNYLSPVLVGNKVNIHPVWMIFGLLAGASLFGFVGALIAVPVVAVVGVLVRFTISEYLDSSYYQAVVSSPKKEG